MKKIHRFALYILLSLSFATPSMAQTKGPSSSQTPYLVPVAPGVRLTSILTVGDSPNNSSYRLGGNPDGLGAFDNNDGTFTLLMNHELNGGFVKRAHGVTGAFVSQWIIDKATLQVKSGRDLIQNVKLWNGSGFDTYNSANPSPLAIFTNFCSGDLAPISAFFNNISGLGTQERIYLNGEELGTQGRAFAHIVTGTEAGTSYQLPYLGKLSWENAVASPFPSNKTIVAGLDDITGGQVYFYIGNKQSTGNEIEKAGLQNGKLFGVSIASLNAESDSTKLESGTRFSLINLGNVANKTGTQLNSDSISAGVTSFLRPEDGAWDPANPRDFYFNTTNNANGPSRLWRLRFDDIANPEVGGIIEAVLDGTEGQKMLDNMTIDRYGHILLQEDVGNNPHLGKIWQYDIATDKLTQLAQHDPSRFLAGGANFLTQNEESSGIIDAQEILGPGWFLFDVQAHGNLGGGQLLALYNPSTHQAYRATVPEPSNTSAIASLSFMMLGMAIYQRLHR